MQLDSKLIVEYDKLIETIEKKNVRLEKEHAGQMLCHRGCSSCCQPFDIVPLEKYIIHKKLADKGIAIPKQQNPKVCKYLKNNECSIYDIRPIMCRTHGFPLLYLNEDETAYEFSTCEKNFVDFDLDEAVEGNCIMMDDHNYVLNQLNIKFLKANPELKSIAGKLVEW